MNGVVKLPFYVRASLCLIGVYVLISMLSIAEELILPLIYATIFAMLLNPLVNYLISKKINRFISITIAVSITIIFIVSLLYFITIQLSIFSDAYPKLKESFNEMTSHWVQWASYNLKMKPSKINAWLDATLNELFNNMIGSAGEALSKINSFLIMVVLFPVYLFMILYYRTLLIEFILKLFNSTHHVAVFDVLLSSKMIIQTYLFGLFVEAILIAILNSAGLLIIGIDYAIILGITGAILNVIPYIGGVIAISLPIVVALITKETSSAAFLVIIVYLVIQFIDNNIIVPNIVASRVRINALVSVIVVLAGGALWGVPGMFLSIPLTAILKVICDHITPLKPWGFLLGNIVPTTSRYNFDITRRSRRKVV